MNAKMKVLGLCGFLFLGLGYRAQINEGFTNPFVWSPSGNGWLRVNNSSPVGTLMWFQGGANTFPAFVGAATDYVACNYNSQGATSGGISNFMITPTVNITNGGVIQFATRTTTTGTWPDRLQLRYSFGTGGAIPSGTASVGTFTNLILDINPNLSTSSSSVVNSGSVNGYPQSWALYTFTLSGISTPGPGRFAFRYFVNDGGPNGSNSDYIGVDEVKYYVPCSMSISSYTICAGGSATLNAVGGISPVNYTWSPGSSSASSIVVSPGSTSVYTLNYSEATGSCPPVTATVTVGNQLSSSIVASSNSVCSGSTVTLTGMAAASNYSWSTGATGSVTTVTPTTSTTYTLGVMNGACFGASTINIGIVPNPSIGISFSPAIFCPNATINAVFSGAITYTSTLNTFSPVAGNPLSIFTDASDSNTTFTLNVQGEDLNGCIGSTTITQYIQPLPTITVSSPTIVCIGAAVTLTASGASTYSWSGSGSVSGTLNPATFSAPASAGVMNITANGTTSLGCNGTSNSAIVVTDCVGLPLASTYLEEPSVFPNPFNDVLKVQHFKGTIKIFNNLGQLLLEKNVGPEELLDTSALVKGTYSLFLQEDAGSPTRVIQLVKH